MNSPVEGLDSGFRVKGLELEFRLQGVWGSGFRSQSSDLRV